MNALTAEYRAEHLIHHDGDNEPEKHPTQLSEVKPFSITPWIFTHRVVLFGVLSATSLIVVDIRDLAFLSVLIVAILVLGSLRRDSNISIASSTRSRLDFFTFSRSFHVLTIPLIIKVAQFPNRTTLIAFSAVTRLFPRLPLHLSPH